MLVVIVISIHHRIIPFRSPLQLIELKPLLIVGDRIDSKQWPEAFEVLFTDYEERFARCRMDRPQRRIALQVKRLNKFVT